MFNECDKTIHVHIKPYLINTYILRNFNPILLQNTNFIKTIKENDTNTTNIHWNELLLLSFTPFYVFDNKNEKY